MFLRVFLICVFVFAQAGAVVSAQTIAKPRPAITEGAKTAYERGTDALKKGDLEGAIYNYTSAIKEDQNLAGAYSGRGAAKRLKGDYEGALADLDQSIRLNSTVQSAFYSRAWLNVILNHGDEAFADATKLFSFNEANQIVFPSHVLIAYFGLRQAKKTSEADAYLKNTFSKLMPSAWTTQIARYLKRELSEDQLISAANGNRAMVESRTWVGMDQSLNGKPESALANLRWVVANTDKRAFEYALASVEIKRLESPSKN
jgi:tetratricopeptide (TPR) repeat protein